MSAPTTVCRFGWDCRRAECWFAHPSGRAIDAGVGGANALPGAPLASNPYAVQSNGVGMGPMGLSGMNPMMMNMQMLPGVSVGGVTVGGGVGGGGMITKPITSSDLSRGANSSIVSNGDVGGKKGPTVCRYGRECHRSECWFLHPEGREIDENPSGRSSLVSSRYRSPVPSPEDFDADLEEFERKGFDGDESLDEPADEDRFVCPCCNDHPTTCTNSECKDRGICACMLDAIDDSNTDDTWRDEWFPASRECPCCGGYIYKCKKQLTGCNSSRCICAKGTPEDEFEDEADILDTAHRLEKNGIDKKEEKDNLDNSNTSTSSSATSSSTSTSTASSSTSATNSSSPVKSPTNTQNPSSSQSQFPPPSALPS